MEQIVRMLVVGLLWRKGLVAVLVKCFDRSVLPSESARMPSSVLSARWQKLQAERDSLEWQLAIAEELGVGPDTLNALQAQIEQLEVPAAVLPVHPLHADAQTENPERSTSGSSGDVQAVEVPG